MSQPESSGKSGHVDRAAVVLLDGSSLCLIERQRAGMTYYLFPGGGVEPGETHEQAAVREAKEELGIDVALKRLVADLTYQGSRQTYFLARIVGGEFGTGTGEEMASLSGSTAGTYRPLWLPLHAAVERDTRPIELVQALLNGYVQDAEVLRLER